MQRSPVDVGATFLKTYFEIFMKNPDLINAFYDTNATITRMSPNSKESFKVSDEPFKKICPFESTKGSYSVHSYTSIPSGEFIIVNVYGMYKPESSTECYFTQEFLLQKYLTKYFIVNDVFFTYSPLNPTLCGAELNAVAPTIRHQQYTPPSSFNHPVQFNPTTLPRQPSAPIPSSYSSPRSESRGKNRIDNFDPSRSITIIDLPKTYNGNEVCSIFSQYGTIKNKFFTFSTVYIEFETVAQKNIALNSRTMYNGHVAKVEDGIVQKYKNYK